jgi:hypothetical protein
MFNGALEQSPIKLIKGVFLMADAKGFDICQHISFQMYGSQSGDGPRTCYRGLASIDKELGLKYARSGYQVYRYIAILASLGKNGYFYYPFIEVMALNSGQAGRIAIYISQLLYTNDILMQTPDKAQMDNYLKTLKVAQTSKENADVIIFKNMDDISDIGKHTFYKQV